MLSNLIASFFQDMMKENCRPFALWLYWSEIYLAIGLAVILLVIPPASLGPLWYAALTYTAYVTYERKWRKKQGEVWEPGQKERTIALLAFVPGPFLLGFLAYLFWQEGPAWVAIILGIAAVAIIPTIVSLIRGKWVDLLVR